MNENKLLKRMVIISIIFICISMGFYFGTFHNGMSEDYEAWSTFGTFIGGVLSPLFSFMSLLAVLIVFSSERKEKKEIEKENIFFQYLNTLDKSYNRIEFIKTDSLKYKGYDCFVSYISIRDEIANYKDLIDECKFTEEHYNILKKHNSIIASFYFRIKNFVQLFIDTSNLVQSL